MVSLILVLLALIVLRILSVLFVQKLFNVLFWLTRSREKASVILGTIFLPGTFVHEMSHFLAALFLWVPVSNLNLMPQIEEKGVRLGSVGIAKTDFIRGSIIGLAPTIVGVGTMFWVTTFATSSSNLQNPWVIALLIYVVFQITHTMFASKSDLHAVLELVVFIAIVSIALILLKIYIPFTYIFQKAIDASPFIQKMSYYLFVPIGFELVFLWIFRKIRA